MSLIDPHRPAERPSRPVHRRRRRRRLRGVRARRCGGRGRAPTGRSLFVARDGQRLPAIVEALAFAAPDLPVLEFPAWDCLPYDRVSPGADAAARRLDALAAMIALRKKPHRAVILTTANALLQRMPPAEVIEAQTFRARPGNQVDMNALIARLETSGFERVPTVRDVGEFAVRGGILDLFAPGADEPLRLDFFGDTLETIRAFDVATQRTTGQRNDVDAAGDERGDADARDDQPLPPQLHRGVRRAVARRRALRGGQRGPPLRRHGALAAASLRAAGHAVRLSARRAGRLRPSGARGDRRAPQADPRLLRGAPAAGRRRAEGRRALQAGRRRTCSISRPTTSSAALPDRAAIEFTPFDTPDAGARKVLHAGARHGRSFAEERADPNANVFDAAVKHIAAVRAGKRRVVVAGWTEGSLDRLAQILAEHQPRQRQAGRDAGRCRKARRRGRRALAVLPLEAGFETDRFVVVAEQDILGDRLVRRSKKRKRAADFIAEAASLSAGDIVVHVDHGIGRFVGLKTIEAAGAPHDCLEIHYAGDDRLFLPVENIELLSRYGSDGAEAVLDKLGGGAWQSRKAKLKKRLLDMAGQLIRIAAERQMRAAPAFNPPDGALRRVRGALPL